MRNFKTLNRDYFSYPCKKTQGFVMKKLVAYLTTGYPDIEFTKDLISSLKTSVDTLELGVPFSDPVADGEVIEKANGLALKNGVKFADVLNLAESSPIDTYLMGYFNSFYNQKMEILIPELKRRGVEGLIIPDLPYEEALQYRELFNNHSRDLIPFIAPTDNRERISQLLKDDRSRFIYLVAYAGITGSGKTEDLKRVIEDIRTSSADELYIGFGVNKESAKEKSRDVDGVIVGSAFVKHLLNDSLSYTQKIDRIVESAKVIKNSIN
jgi:tryptophan synthase alpha chain